MADEEEQEAKAEEEACPMGLLDERVAVRPMGSMACEDVDEEEEGRTGLK